MWKCERCERHVLPVVQVCPFCMTMRVAGWSTAVVTPIVLSACYGAPPCEPGQTMDGDAAGFVVPRSGEFCDLYEAMDCDDRDADVNPAAEEICGDGIDNDCDGWEASEDNVEACNGVDDDCDGEIDEDDACATPDTGSPVVTSALSVRLSWQGDVDTCEAAGVQTLTVALRRQPDAEPMVSRDLECDDAELSLEDLPVGAWLVEASAASADGARAWASAAQVVTLEPETTSPVTLDLACSAPSDPDACSP